MMKKKCIRFASVFSAGILLLGFSGCGQKIEEITLSDTVYPAVNETEQATVSETETGESISDTEGGVDNGTAESAEEITYGDFTFSTLDIDGNSVDYSDFADAKLIMINMWEPWCSPCVGELGDLELLYENYKDQGFVIVGAFFSSGYDAEVRDLISSNGITYPIVWGDSNIERLSSDYVPTTVFVDNHGNILSEQYIGSNSYSDWESIILQWL